MMNRRTFLHGLLSSVALPAMAKAIPVAAFPEPSQTQLAIIEMMKKANKDFIQELTQKVEQTIIYGNPDWHPIRFTGVHLNVPCFETDEIIDE